MGEASITCKITKDTVIRCLVLMLALIGIGLTFFYDALVSYPKENLAYFSYQAFANAAEEAKDYSPEEWRAKAEQLTWLAHRDAFYPLPSAIDLSSYPQQLLDHELLISNWHQAWLNYSAEMQFDSKPTHTYDTTDILGQKIAGSSCFLVGLLLLLVLRRKVKGSLSIIGNQVQINNHQLKISDITLIDLRQWGVGYKGIAYFHTKDQQLKVDGMSYGGFNTKQGQPAQSFMTAVLAQYKGEIIDYAQEKQ